MHKLLGICSVFFPNLNWGSVSVLKLKKVYPVPAENCKREREASLALLRSNKWGLEFKTDLESAKNFKLLHKIKPRSVFFVLLSTLNDFPTLTQDCHHCKLRGAGKKFKFPAQKNLKCRPMFRELFLFLFNVYLFPSKWSKARKTALLSKKIVSHLLKQKLIVFQGKSN